MRAFSVGLLLLTVSACLGLPSEISAQQDTIAGPRFREAFASLPEGHTVRVLRASGTTVGNYSGIVGDSLSLVIDKAGPTTLALDDVDAAWSRKHQAGKGALIGGISGVVLGGLLGAGAQSFCEGVSSGCGSTGEAIAVGCGDGRSGGHRPRRAHRLVYPRLEADDSVSAMNDGVDQRTIPDPSRDHQQGDPYATSHQ